MNRATRRKSIAEFRRSASRVDVLTYLIDGSDTALECAPFLPAVLHWRGRIASRKPRCVACKSLFTVMDASVGGWLFASPEGTSAISVTAFCSSCWSSLDDAELERVAVKVLHAIKPNGRFAS